MPRDIFAPGERERLLEAMAVSCGERGYAQTSVEQVVSDAGLSQEDFERNFKSKEECAVAAIESILAETMAVVSGAYSADSSEMESGLKGVKAMLELFAARPALAKLAFIEARQMPREALSLYESGTSVLTAMIDRLRIYTASDTPIPPRAARGALGGAEALVRRELLAGRAEQLPTLLPDIVYGALVPFLDQQETLRYAGLARELLNEGG